MNGSNPVPLPPAEPSGAARVASKPKWMVPAIAAGCAVVLLSAGGGCLYWSHGRLTEASGECEAAYSKAVKERGKLAGYLKSDALKTAITVRDSQVADAKTVAVLASTVKAASTMKTDIPGCPADGLKGIRAAAAARQDRGRVREGRGRGQGQGGCGQRVEDRQDRHGRDQGPGRLQGQGGR